MTEGQNSDLLFFYMHVTIYANAIEDERVSEGSGRKRENGEEMNSRDDRKSEWKSLNKTHLMLPNRGRRANFDRVAYENICIAFPFDIRMINDTKITANNE